MLSEIILYLIGILGLVAGILLVERLVAGPRSTAGTGYASVDSAFDYERLLRRQTRARMTGLLRRRDGGALPLLPEAATATRHFRDAGEKLIPVAAIVGSVDGAAHLFDRSFRPVSDRAHARLASVLLAMRRGEALPPIEVWAWRSQYYVLDGHHRVAAARALGDDYIDARVTEVLESSRSPIGAECGEPCAGGSRVV